MLNNRHLTTVEQKTLLAILEDAGAVETLRMIGQYVANEHFDMHTGTDYRSKIFAIAKLIDSDSGPNIPR